MEAVRLASWKECEGRERVEVLRELGFHVVFESLDPGRLLKAVKEDPPRALVIDLDRAPAAGRDVGVALRVQAATRRIPLVFAGGNPEKTTRVREILSDAEFTPWSEVGPALIRAMEDPPSDPVKPESALSGYSGTPLPKKLGIKETTRVLLVGAPIDFPSTLGPLPAGAALAERFSPSVGLILWFVRSRGELMSDLGKWVARVGPGGIWIIWPKKSSGVSSDLQQSVVRQAGLEAGLVDYKIAAVDQTWSGLKFAVRK